MKKKLLMIVGVALVASSIVAQDTTKLKSKKGEQYLPEAGDYAIGFDALPLINTIGKLVSNNGGGTAVTGTGGATNYITGKYFKDAHTAYRVVLGINYGVQTNNVLVNDVTSSATPPAQVTDVQKISNNSWTLGAGMEKRRGKTRLQGYYGAMAMITFGGGPNNTYTYGNALTATNTAATNSFGQGAGVTSTNTGETFGLKLNGFVGAEYFVLPKISLGAEYWWGIGYTSTGEGKSVVESWNGTSSISTTTKTAGNSAFNIGGMYAGTAAVFVNVHF